MRETHVKKEGGVGGLSYLITLASPVPSCPRLPVQ